MNINRGDWVSGNGSKMLYFAIKHLQACGIEARIATRNRGGNKDRVYSGVRIRQYCPARILSYQINYSYCFIPAQRFESFRRAEPARYGANFAARAKIDGV